MALSEEGLKEIEAGMGSNTLLHTQLVQEAVDAVRRLQAIVDACAAECPVDDSLEVNERVALLADRLKREKRHLARIALWLATNNTGTPVPEWCELVWREGEPVVDPKHVEMSEAVAAGGATLAGPRPFAACVCGHPLVMHSTGCLEDGCECQAFSASEG